MPSFVRLNKAFLYKSLRPIVVRLRSNSITVKMLWGLKMPEDIKPNYDTITLLMRKALKDCGKDVSKFLELGIGEAALNALYFKKLHNTIVHGVDISKARVDSSSTVALTNKLDVSFFPSDLFNNVHDKYDLIVFNPPYLPTAVGQKLELTKKMNLDSDKVWDGGKDGSETIRNFLSGSTNFLSEGGCILLGVQNIYLSDVVMRNLFMEYNFKVLDVFSNAFINLLIPTSIYKISLK